MSSEDHIDFSHSSSQYISFHNHIRIKTVMVGHSSTWFIMGWQSSCPFRDTIHTSQNEYYFYLNGPRPPLHSLVTYFPASGPNIKSLLWYSGDLCHDNFSHFPRDLPQENFIIRNDFILNGGLKKFCSQFYTYIPKSKCSVHT